MHFAFWLLSQQTSSRCITLKKFNSILIMGVFFHALCIDILICIVSKRAHGHISSVVRSLISLVIEIDETIAEEDHSFCSHSLSAA